MPNVQTQMSGRMMVLIRKPRWSFWSKGSRFSLGIFNLDASGNPGEMFSWQLGKIWLEIRRDWRQIIYLEIEEEEKGEEGTKGGKFIYLGFPRKAPISNIPGRCPHPGFTDSAPPGPGRLWTCCSWRRPGCSTRRPPISVGKPCWRESVYLRAASACRL